MAAATMKSVGCPGDGGNHSRFSNEHVIRWIDLVIRLVNHVMRFSVSFHRFWGLFSLALAFYRLAVFVSVFIDFCSIVLLGLFLIRAFFHFLLCPTSVSFIMSNICLHLVILVI